MNAKTIAAVVLAFALAVGVGFGVRWAGKAGIGDECEVDGDCRSFSAICLQSYADRTCTQLCTTDDECPEGEVCREADLQDETGTTDTAHEVCAPPPPTLDTFRED
ncbi:MAG: hypothetical protein JJ863_02355 [Deltaproteobacteria bacterium]|nr:hypothetical protein [Deltaproteobacteria bacterium]